VTDCNQSCLSALGCYPDVKTFITAMFIRRNTASGLWLELVLAVIAQSLLLLPAKLQAKLWFHHKTGETSALQRARAPSVFRSRLV